MVRKTSGLFIASSENVLFVCILYGLLSGIMSMVMPIDFSPLMRGAMQSQLVLVILSGGLLVAISAMDRVKMLIGIDDDGDDQTTDNTKYEPVAGGDIAGAGDDGHAQPDDDAALLQLTSWVRERVSRSCDPLLFFLVRKRGG